MALIKNKKGYFFTLTVILLLALLFIYFSAYKDPGFTSRSKVTEQRLQELNRMILLIEKDSETGLRVATFRTIMDLDANVTESGPIQPSIFNELINELLINGTINNNNQFYSENHSMSDWEKQILLALKNMGAEAKFSDSKAYLNQTSPWLISATYKTTLNVSDSFTKSTWTKNFSTTTHMSVQDFYDPLFSINTEAKRKINKLPEWQSKNNLSNIIEKEYYLESDNSPSFLQRFQVYNNLNHEYVGIVSLIDKNSYLVENKPRPIMDSVYFLDTDFEPCIAQGHLLATGYNNIFGVTCFLE